MNYKDKVVWITGASSGIGAAMAAEFNEQGARVILSARRGEELEKVREGFTNPAIPSLVLPFDISDHSVLQDRFNSVIDHFGKLDIIIQNAGISCSGLAAELPLEIHRKVMEVDHFSNIALTQVVLPHFIEKDSGQLILVSSILGLVGTKYRSAYAAAKHALHGYYNCLRAEVSDNIHVGILTPGYVRTDVMLNAITPDGSRLNQRTSDNARGMDPAIFAKKALKKIRKRKPLFYVSGAREIFGVYLNLLFPSLYARIVRKLDHTA